MGGRRDPRRLHHRLARCRDRPPAGRPQPGQCGSASAALGLISYARRWSSQEDERLVALAARGTTLEAVAQRLGRTPEAIRRHASRLGIGAPPPGPTPRRDRRWTRDEDELLRLHRALNPARLAELLGRSDGAVCRRLCALGLRARAQRSPHHPGKGRMASGLGPAVARRPAVRLLRDPSLAAGR